MLNNTTPSTTSGQTRREFIKQSTLLAGTAGVGLALGPQLMAQSPGANEKIVFGLIGCGSMGREDMRHFLRLNQTVAAVCDVDQSHADRAAAEVVQAGQAQPKKYKDFRQLLEQKDINAVIIGTPDHWHALTFIAACEAGKDIYCEKPISHNLIEAKAMLAAARHFNRVVQIGTWQRSMKHFQNAIAFVRSGQMGRINLCRAWMCHYLPDIGRQSAQNPPPGISTALCK